MHSEQKYEQRKITETPLCKRYSEDLRIFTLLFHFLTVLAQKRFLGG